MADCKAKGFKEQNGTVKWSVKKQQVKLCLLNTTLEIVATILQISPFNYSFSPCCLLLCFCLATFCILHAIELTLFWRWVGLCAEKDFEIG